MKRKYICLLVVIMLVSALAGFGCGKADKAPAEVAIKAAEEAVASLKAEAVKYVPEDVKSVESALAAAKDKLAKNDFKAAAVEGQAVVAKAKELLDSLKVKKEELARKWDSLSVGLPKMIGAVENRVNILSKSRKLPASITADKFADAKSLLAASRDEWAKALASSKAGNMGEAALIANSVKEKAAKAMEALGMTVPAGAK
jgi:hypothetical protein